MNNKPLFYFIFALFLCVSVYSQNTDNTDQYHKWVNKPTQTFHLPSGYFFYVKQVETHLSNGDTLQALTAQRLAAIASFKLGNLKESENLAVEALTWLETGNFTSSPKSHKVGLYNQLGMIYSSMGHYKKALRYYDLGLLNVEQKLNRITIYNNRGNAYSELGNLLAAKTDLQQAINLSKTLMDTLHWARAKNNMGVLKIKQGNEAGAVDIREALQMRKQINDLEGIYSSYRHLAFFALSEKDSVLAKKYTINTLNIAKKLNSPSFELESLSMLINLNKDNYVSRYKVLTDSINKAKNEEQFLFAALNFDVEKEKVNTQQAELKLEKERNQKVFILIIAVLLSLLLLSIIALILIRIKSIKQAEVLKTESRISKKVHDEVANEVYQVMVRLQVNLHKDEDVLDDLEHIYKKSRDISKEYQVLDSRIPFDEIITDLLNSYQSEPLKIMLRYSAVVNWDYFSQNIKNTVYRVLQELMTNMKKHSQATLVVVSFSQKGEKLTINYSDNGVGTLLKKQNGLQNAENRIFALKGSIIFDSQPNKGFKVIITI